MDHIAILSKKYLPLIISGKKIIESRWYKFKRDPYKNIFPNDLIYFKESGSLVSVKAKVKKVLFFNNLNRYKTLEILAKYEKKLCLPLSHSAKLKEKNFCVLIFIKNVKKIRPFVINKKGYGAMCAWITVKNISLLKI